MIPSHKLSSGISKILPKDQWKCLNTWNFHSTSDIENLKNIFSSNYVHGWRDLLGF